MKTSDFKIWFDQLSQLSRGQQEQVKQHLGQVVVNRNWRARQASLRKV